MKLRFNKSFTRFFQKSWCVGAMPQALRKRLQIIFFGDINLYGKKLKFRGGNFKMKLKKLVSLVSAVTMTAVCLAGCGSTAGSSSSQGSVSESVSASASAETSSDTESTDAVNVSLLKGKEYCSIRKK